PNSVRILTGHCKIQMRPDRYSFSNDVNFQLCQKRNRNCLEGVFHSHLQPMAPLKNRLAFQNSPHSALRMDGVSPENTFDMKTDRGHSSIRSMSDIPMYCDRSPSMAEVIHFACS